MTVRIGVVMDPIDTITPYKDSTLAMLLAAQRRGWTLAYIEHGDLVMEDGRARGLMHEVTVYDDDKRWYELGDSSVEPLDALDVLLMRKDPPFNSEYVYSTYLLEQAEQRGTLVVNAPRALRDVQEKLSTAWFPQCTPPALVARRADVLRRFAREQEHVVFKPIDAMGGASIFVLRADDPNLNVVLELMTAHDTRMVMAQRYIPEIAQGDKRILLVDGEPIGGALARIPAAGETRGNLAAGARAEGRELSERDRWICSELGSWLRERGLIFVGIDVIGDYLTEINVTSPTGIREIHRLFGVDVSEALLDAVERRLDAGRDSQ